MIYVRATAVGLVSGVLCAIVVMAALRLVYGPVFLSSLMNDGIAASAIALRSLVVAALLGFGAGFGWTVRRGGE
jgi:hypothetical protein